MNKLKIPQAKIDVNLKFYFMLKYLVKSKIAEKQCILILEHCLLMNNNNFKTIKNKLLEIVGNFTGQEKQDSLFSIIETLEWVSDLYLFIFSIKLYLIKNLLLQEAKLSDVLLLDKLSNVDPLSLEYDKISVLRPYATRVNWALLSLLFFDNLEKWNTNFISQQSEEYLKELSMLANKAKESGVEPNQIFMLMFSESINQSIISDSWTDYEDRILSVLTKIWIPESDISKIHDKNDSSTEFDFFFNYNWRTFWIWAKRTLRERYKQFIKTAHMSQIDVMIEITLWLDLNEEKAKSIISHWVYIFVADEVYQSREYLQTMEWVYSVKNLSQSTLKTL